MTLHVRPFPAELAGVVSGWAKTGDEVLMWCGAKAAPVPAEQIRAWGDEEWTEPFGLFRGGVRGVVPPGQHSDEGLAGYGELWGTTRKPRWNWPG